MTSMDYFLAMMMLLIGLALGAGATWLLLRAKMTAAFERGRREAAAETAALCERLLARDDTIEELRNRLTEKEAARGELQGQVTDLSAKAADLSRAIAEQQKQSQEKLALLDEARRQLADAFKALAADALKSNSTSFLELARTHLEKFQESAKGDLEKRQSAIGELVKPVAESLTKVDAKLHELEKLRLEAYCGLTEQVKALSETDRKSVV